MELLQIEEHSLAPVAFSFDHFETPVMRRDLGVYLVAEIFQVVGVIAVIRNDLSRRIPAAENDRENQSRRAPFQDPGACRVVLQKSRHLGREQQAKRWDDGINPVDSFRRDERHEDNAAHAPKNQPKGFRRGVPQKMARASLRSAKNAKRIMRSDQGANFRRRCGR